MAKANRVQLGLLFNDDALFSNLVEPYKASKELTPLIIRLLTMYYYNAEVRNLVDDAEVVETENSTANHIESLLASGRDNFLLLKGFLDSGENSIEYGVQQVVKAYESGIAKTIDNSYEKFGSLNSPLILSDVKKMKEDEELQAKLELEKEELKKQQEVSSKDASLDSLSKDMSEMKATVSKLCEALMGGGAINSLQAEVVTPKEPQYVEKVEEVKIVNTTPYIIQTESKDEDLSNIYNEGQHTESDDVENTDDDLDGTEALKNLLAGV